MIKLRKLLIENEEMDVKRIQVAFNFFIKELGLPKNRIKLEFDHLEVDPDSGLPTQASVYVSKDKRYTVTMRNNNPMSLDTRIRHLAHEMQHIKQVESGIFDPYTHMWNGVKYEVTKGTEEYYNLPWEKDARGVVVDLELALNRYMREKGSGKKVIKLNENPDTVSYKRKLYSYTSPANRCAFFVYKDDKSGKKSIFGYSDNKKEFYSDDSDVLKDIKEIEDAPEVKYDSNKREQLDYWAQKGIKRLKASSNGGGHLDLENILKGLGRMGQYSDPIMKGRIFEVDNTDGKPPENLDLQIESTIPSGKAIIVTFWNYNKNTVTPYKDQYEKVIEFNGYNPEECLYEIGSGIISYNQLYDKEEPKKETPPPESKSSVVDKVDVVFKVGDKVRLKGFKDVVGDVTHIDGDYVTVNITSSKYSLGPFRQGRDIKQLASGMELVQPDVGTKSSDSFKVGDKIKIVGMDIKADVTAIKGNNVSIKVTDSNLLSLPVGTEFDYPNWGLQKIEEQPSLEKVIDDKTQEFVEKRGKLHTTGAALTTAEKENLEKEVDGLEIEIKILNDLLTSGEKSYTDNIKSVVNTVVQRKLHAKQKEKQDRYSLIAQAEKQYGMPIAQIRQKYRGVPLDQLVKKESLYKRMINKLILL